MLRLSKKADYALMAMKHLAMRPDAASASAREIAEQYDIPIELMAKVLQRLARRGLLTSHQGTARRLPARARRERDFGRRHHPGDRRPADGHGLFDRSRELRPVSRNAASAIRCGGSRIGSSRRWPPVRSRRSRPSRRSREQVASALPLAQVALMSTPVYLDYHATTPVDPRVLDAMLPYFTEQFGNPASRQHAYGWEAQEAVEQARDAGRGADQCVGRRDHLHQRRHRVEQPGDQGCRRALSDRGDHVITVATEHKSVLDSCARSRAGRLERHACCRLQPDGFVDLDELRARVTDRTVLVSVMAANNEIGVAAAARPRLAPIVHEQGALLHTDAAQAAGKVPIDVADAGIDLLSLTAHKCYGPKGAGALYRAAQRAEGCRSTCQIDGGGHENGLAIGHAERARHCRPRRAARKCAREMLPQESARLAGLRDRLLAGLAGRARWHPRQRIARATAAAQPARQLRRTSKGEALLMALGDLAVSTGSACSSGSQAPSHVLVGDRRGRRARRRLDPIRPRPLDHRRRHRFCDRSRHDRRAQLEAAPSGCALLTRRNHTQPCQTQNHRRP